MREDLAHGLDTEACSALESATIAAEGQRFAEHASYDLTELRASIERNQRQPRRAWRNRVASPI